MQQSTACVLLCAFLSLLIPTFSLASIQPTVGYVQISGTVIYSSQNEIEIAFFTDPLMFREESFVAVIQQGQYFNLNIPIEAPSIGEIRYQGHSVPIWLEPGKNIQLDFDGSNFPASLRFSGVETDANSFLAAYYTAFGQINQRVEAFMETATPESYADFIVSIQKERMRFVGNDAHFSKVPDALKKYIHTSETYWAAAQLMRFAFDKPIFSGGAEPLVLPDSYYVFLKSLEINKIDALNNPEYRVFLDRYAEYLAFQNKNNQVESVYELAEKKLQGTAKEYIQGRELAQACRINRLDPKVLESRVQAYLSTCTHPGLTLAVSGFYEKTLVAKEGQLAPAFSLTNAAGSVVSLADFKGKVVYIEFWATWCAPCREEMAKVEQLSSKYDQNVVFLYLSVDKDEAAWRNFVANKNQNTHLMAGDLRQSKTAERYGVRALPACFLIDQQGRLAYAKKRSDDLSQLPVLIDSLLSTRISALAH